MKTHELIGKTYNQALEELGVAPIMYHDEKLISILDGQTGERVITDESEAMFVEDLAEDFGKFCFEEEDGSKKEISVCTYEEKESFSDKHPYLVKGLAYGAIGLTLLTLGMPFIIPSASAQASNIKPHSQTLPGEVMSDHLSYGATNSTCDDVYQLSISIPTGRAGNAYNVNISIDGKQDFNLSALEQSIVPGDLIKFTTFAVEKGTPDNYYVKDIQEITLEEYLQMKSKIESNAATAHLCNISLMGLSLAMIVAMMGKRR